MKINIKIYYTPIPESIAKNTKENTIKRCNSSMITLTLIVILYNNEIHAQLCTCTQSHVLSIIHFIQWAS